jgi:hypothetical protein
VKLRLPQPYIPHRPSPKQSAFLLYDGLEAFYGGAAGGGKTDALLMGALQYIDNPKYSAVLFRRSFTDLGLSGALMDRSHEWLNDTEAKWDRERHTWVFPSGATLTFGYIQTPKDKWRYQSAEFQYIGWDEITEFPDDDAYLFLFSRLRRIKDSGIPLRVRCASNPVGQGAGWVRKRFINMEPPPFRLEFDENGQSKKVEDFSQRIFIPAKFTDNAFIGQEAYLLSLSQLPQATQERLIAGSWEAIESAAFPHFDEELHVIDPIRIPDEWRRWEGMDYGTKNPTAWYAAALSPEVCTVIYDEYYSPGLISRHASAILTLRANRWGQPQITLCDPSVRAQTGFGITGRGDSVYSEFAKNGISLVPANNDRRAGLVRISELLLPDPSREFPDWHPRAGEYGCPGLFITRNCQELIEQLKYAPLDPKEGETIDPYWESRHGHGMAAARYLLTARVYPGGDVSNPADLDRRGRDWSHWATGTQWKEL